MFASPYLIGTCESKPALNCYRTRVLVRVSLIESNFVSRFDDVINKRPLVEREHISVVHCHAGIDIHIGRNQFYTALVCPTVCSARSCQELRQIHVRTYDIEPLSPDGATDCCCMIQ